MTPTIVRLAAGTVGFLAAGASVFACRQLAGIDAYFSATPDAGVNANACGLPYGSGACASCAGSHCCVESMRCQANPSCKEYASCFGRCSGDPACWAQCLTAHPTDDPEVTALSVCMATQCETDCALTCGAFAGTPTPPDAAAGCQTCLVDNECAATRQCAGSVDCDAIDRCTWACRTVDCRQACRLAHHAIIDFGPQSVDAGAVDASSSAACKVDCEVGSYWACVGHVSWPAPTSTSINWHFWARDFYTASPVPELDVTVCPFNDQSGTSCSLPLTHGTTDSQGFVPLPFVSQTIGAGGPVSTGFLGYLAITGSTIRPYYYEWDFPITQSDFFSYGLTLTPTEAEQLYAPFNVQLDASRGILAVAVYDCLGNLAPGVQLTLSTSDGVRSFSPLGRETLVTDEKGLLGFVNVPAGEVTVTATPLSLGKVSSRFTSFVRAGATTSLQMVPTPPGQ